MSRFCLDTSAYSWFRRGHEATVTEISRASWLGVPTIVLGELRTGFLLGGRARENEEALLEFLGHPVVEVLAVDDETSRLYAEIVRDLRLAGTPLPTNDVWIAAVAARAGASVLTHDRHFEAVPRVGARILA